MAGSFGGAVKLTGESDYRKALRGISDDLKLLSSEMKVATSQYDKNDNSLKNLKGQSEVMSKQYEQQKEKVAVLTKALADAEKETGKDSETTKKWQTELNKAQAELNKTEKSVKELSKQSSGIGALKTAFSDWKKHLEDIKGKLSPITNGLKNVANAAAKVASTSFKAFAAGVGAVSAGLVKLGKDAISAYADAEQLKGGVETLFKGASAEVIKNANDAFKTAGMSANEYMENVTSFSASLISSVGGDTAKAAKIADQAIIDMSDNANKMGTDISSIQNAYQGFAKGNYTMLDNLKLG